MRWRQVVLLYLVLAALGGEYWLVERHARPGEPAAAPAPPPFLHLDPASLREIRLVRGGRTIVSRREGDGWTVVEPPGAAIAPDLIAAFTNALADATEIARVGGADADPHAFGLDDQAARVEVISTGSDPVEVTIGGTNPTGTAVYARRRGAPDVVLIGRNVRYYEDLIFQAVSVDRIPATEAGAPIGG
ncbi:MAG TPA: DUF4340 domain-containing protein [Gemmatimonadales bacterium]|jgi:hypothetical protein|nr:DUF4340 domain-containing protein [Gemmatimonadales bacterium]